MSQHELAGEAGISFQAVQLLESGRGNPSLETMDLLAGALGWRVELTPQGADWQWLAVWGLPWEESAASPSTVTVDLPRLKREVVAAWEETRGAPTSRQAEALTAFLLALRDHFPTAFHRCFRRSAVETGLEAQPYSGRIIKLRRMALARLAEIL